MPRTTATYDATVRGNRAAGGEAGTQRYGVAIVGAHDGAIVTGNNVRGNAVAGFEFPDGSPAVLANDVD